MYEDLLEMAAGCVETIRVHVEKLAGLEEKLVGLEGRTCTGREWWRDVDVPGKTPKLYVLHSVDADCPIHGKPEPGGRLRVYVGSEGGKIGTAKAQIALEKERQSIEVRARDVRRGLDAGVYHLQMFYTYLPRSHSDYGAST